MSAIAAARAEAGTDDDTLADPPTRADEAILLSFYAHRALAIAVALRLPRSVAAAGAAFTARFFLGASALEHDPREVTVAALYLAAKVEEAYISADRLGAALAGESGGVASTTTAAPGAAILRREPALLAGLGFDLVTHTPHRAVEGLFADVMAVRSTPGGADALGEPLASAPAAALAKAHGAALASANVLSASDAPLLYPPGQLALAALQSGLRKAGIAGSAAYVRRVAGVGAGAAGAALRPGARLPSPPLTTPTPDPADLQALEAALSALDALGTAAATCPTAEDARAADARLRRARSVLLEKARGEAAARDAAAKAARETKVAAARAAASAREEALLGVMPEVGAAPAGDDGGVGKRRRSDAAGGWVGGGAS